MAHSLWMWIKLFGFNTCKSFPLFIYLFENIYIRIERIFLTGYYQTILSEYHGNFLKVNINWCEFCDFGKAQALCPLWSLQELLFKKNHRKSRHFHDNISTNRLNYLEKLNISLKICRKAHHEPTQAILAITINCVQTCKTTDQNWLIFSQLPLANCNLHNFLEYTLSLTIHRIDFSPNAYLSGNGIFKIAHNINMHIRHNHQYTKFVEYKLKITGLYCQQRRVRLCCHTLSVC